MMARKQSTPLDPAIHRGRIDVLRIYEISEDELNKLEQGSPESIFFNFGLNAISVAISFAITLATARIDNNQIFIVFALLVIVGFLAGAVLLSLWVRYRRTIKSTASQIRSRLPPVGLQDVLPTVPE